MEGDNESTLTSAHGSVAVPDAEKNPNTQSVVISPRTTSMNTLSISSSAVDMSLEKVTEGQKESISQEENREVPDELNYSGSKDNPSDTQNGQGGLSDAQNGQGDKEVIDSKAIRELNFGKNGKDIIVNDLDDECDVDILHNDGRQSLTNQPVRHLSSHISTNGSRSPPLQAQFIPPVTSALYTTESFEEDLVGCEALPSTSNPHEQSQKPGLRESMSSLKQTTSGSGAHKLLSLNGEEAKAFVEEKEATGQAGDVQLKEDREADGMTVKDVDKMEKVSLVASASSENLSELTKEVGEDLQQTEEGTDSPKRKKKLKEVVKRKDGVKRTIKTAPVKLANIISTKTPSQQKNIVTGVTKRLAKRPDSRVDESSKVSLTKKSLSGVAVNEINGTVGRGLRNGKRTTPLSQISKKQFSYGKITADKASPAIPSVGKWRNAKADKAELTKTRLQDAAKPANEDQKLLASNQIKQEKGGVGGVASPVEENTDNDIFETKPDESHLKLPPDDGDRRDSNVSCKSNDSILIHLNQVHYNAQQAAAGDNKEPISIELMANHGSLMKSAIPYLPLPLAVVCLIMNILLPGAGTILSGFSVLCCGRPRVEGKDGQIYNTVCLNLFVGIAQMVTITFMLVGWFWSVSWGINMIILAKMYGSSMKRAELELNDDTFSVSNMELQTVTSTSSRPHSSTMITPTEHSLTPSVNKPSILTLAQHGHKSPTLPQHNSGSHSATLDNVNVKHLQ